MLYVDIVLNNSVTYSNINYYFPYVDAIDENLIGLR